MDPNVVVSGQAASSGEREAALLEQSSNTKFVAIVAISLVSREGSAHFNVGSASAEFGNQCASTQARADAARACVVVIVAGMAIPPSQLAVLKEWALRPQLNAEIVLKSDDDEDPERGSSSHTVAKPGGPRWRPNSHKQITCLKCLAPLIVDYNLDFVLAFNRGATPWTVKGEPNLCIQHGCSQLVII